MTGKAAQRLIRRLRAAGERLPDDTELFRTYAGPSDRARGAWSWFLSSRRDGDLGVGSVYPVLALLRCRALTVTPQAEYVGRDRFVDPCVSCAAGRFPCPGIVSTPQPA